MAGYTIEKWHSDVCLDTAEHVGKLLCQAFGRVDGSSHRWVVSEFYELEECLPGCVPIAFIELARAGFQRRADAVAEGS